jgi:hypothetical protein
LFRFAESYWLPIIREADPGLVFEETIGLVDVFFFQKKKQKALFRFAESYWLPIIREADPGGLGACPKEEIGIYNRK